jgi:hypothetical protein
MWVFWCLLSACHVLGGGGGAMAGFGFMSVSKILFGKMVESSFRWFCFLCSAYM